MVSDREIQIAVELLKRVKTLVWIAIPLWIVATKLKDWISLFFKRISLKSSLIISMDGLYEIDGKKGKLTHFGWRRITLQGQDGKNYYIPMEVAVRSTITRLDNLNGYYKRRGSDVQEKKKRKSTIKSNG